MNKKLLTIGGSVILGGLLLGATAFAAISTNTGYEAYKNAFKKSITLKSVTPKVSLTIKDNGKLIANVDATVKMDKDAKTMSSTISIDDGLKQKTFDIFKTGIKTIFKSSDSEVYNVLENQGKKDHPEKAFNQRKHNPQEAQGIETIFDAVAGSFENYTTINTNPDGSKDVAFKLSENQVSPVLNAVASLAVKNIAKEDNFGHEGTQFGVQDSLKTIKDKLPKLLDNIKVISVTVDANINPEDYINNQVENITISGKDAAGADHVVTVSLNTTFTDYNKTTPDTIDLTGKQVKEIQTPIHEKE